MDEALAPVGQFGQHRVLREGGDDLGGEVDGVDHFAFGEARVDRDALDLDGCAIGGEAFVFNLAQFAAVEGIGEVDPQIGGQAFVNAAADFFIGGEGEADLAVRDLGVGQKVAGGGHQDGHTGLVVGPQKREAGGGDDVMALFVGEFGGDVGGEGQRRVIGVGDGPAVVAADHAGFDAGGVELRRGVDMGEKADGGAGGGCGQRGQHGAVVGEGDVGGTNLGQLLHQKAGHIELNGCGGRGFAGGIGLAVDRAIAGQAGFKFCVHVGHGRAFGFCAPVGPGRRAVSSRA